MSDLKPFNLREAILQSINSQGGVPALIANV